jgi:transposase
MEQLSRAQLLVVVAEQARVIQAQAAKIDEQAARVEELAAQVAELTRRLGQNSGNSSLPPSSDRFAKPKRARRAGSSRKPGKQPGAPGSALEYVADPDQVIEHVPPRAANAAPGWPAPKTPG